jgi:hypothetical protein
MQNELSSHDSVKAELKQKRENLKQNYDQGVKQIEYLKQMEIILHEKLRFKKEGREENKLRGTDQRGAGGVNVLKMDN